MSDAQIRPTISADLDALADVLVEVHAVDGYPVEGVDNPNAWLELTDPIGQWTALLDGRPVGHVALLRPTVADAAPGLFIENHGGRAVEIGVVARLFIAPHARGRGLAAALLSEAEELARQSGLTPVLDVMTKDQAAIKLYQSRGWRVLGSIQHTYGTSQPVQALAMAADGNNHLRA